MWPANMLANRRRASVTGRTMMLEKNSSGISSGRIGPLMPAGHVCSLR